MARNAAVFALAGVPRVDLMPPAEIERRRRSSLVRGWGWGVVGALVVAFLIVMGAVALKFVADQQLAAEQMRTNALLTELAGLSEVSQALAEEQDLTAFRAEAMGSDFAWTPVVSTIQSALPAGVALTGFHLATGGVPLTDDPTAEVGLIGTLTLTSQNPVDLPTTIREVRQLAGVAMVDGRALTSGQESVGGYSYELDLTLDQSIYSGQYALTEGAE